MSEIIVKQAGGLRIIMQYNTISGLRHDAPGWWQRTCQPGGIKAAHWSWPVVHSSLFIQFHYLRFSIPNSQISPQIIIRRHASMKCDINDRNICMPITLIEILRKVPNNDIDSHRPPLCVMMRIFKRRCSFFDCCNRYRWLTPHVFTEYNTIMRSKYN